MYKLTSTRFGPRAFCASIALPLVALTLWLIDARNAEAAQPAVHLIVGGKEAPFVVPPYIDNTGTVMAPVDFVRLLGANYAVAPDGNVMITSAAGKTFEESFQHLHDRLMVPLQPTAMTLGASITWSATSNTMTLRSKLEVARVDGDSFDIGTSYPVYYKTQTLDDPSRLVIDLLGTDLDAPPTSIPADDPNVLQIRSGQLDDQTVRLVLDLTHPIQYQVACSLQTSAVKLALNTDVTNTTPVPVINSAPVVPIPVENVAPSATSVLTSTAMTQAGINGAVGPSRIVNVEYKSVNSDVSQVIVTTAGPVNVSTNSYTAFLMSNPNRLVFEVNNSVPSVVSSVGAALDSLVPGPNPLFRLIRWGVDSSTQQSNGRVVLDLDRPILYTVSTENLNDNSGVRYIINIQQSADIADNSSSNSIEGKIIVVDAGHGGKDSGAPGRTGIYEKNFTLSIAKLVRDALTSAGATAIMTRSDDTFIPLDARSQLGIDSHADYFISIHCDSSGQQNSHSGDTVYYHGDNTLCRNLAKSIANRLAQLDISIQSDGVKSDYVRFPGIGFSVLRKSPEPAVLVECGYVNNDQDASCLADTDSQQEIATGIVAGLRDFVENQ